MTTKQIEALQLALENICAAKLCEFNSMSSRHEMIRLMDAAITAIREAMAEQPANVTAVNTSSERVDKTEENVHEKPAQQQEPVAWILKPTMELLWPDEIEVKDLSKSKGYKPLYTSPPASKLWVGLTDDEIDECYYWKDRQWTTDELVRHVEAKLREKNA